MFAGTLDAAIAQALTGIAMHAAYDEVGQDRRSKMTVHHLGLSLNQSGIATAVSMPKIVLVKTAMWRLYAAQPRLTWLSRLGRKPTANTKERTRKS